MGATRPASGIFQQPRDASPPLVLAFFFSAFEVTYNLPKNGCTDTKKAETDALPCVWGKASCFRHYNLASGYVKARISTPFRVSSLR